VPHPLRNLNLKPSTIVDRRGKIKKVLYAEKNEAVCDLCGGSYSLYEEGARGDILARSFVSSV